MTDMNVFPRRGEYAAPLSADVTAGRLVFERGTANDVIAVDHAMPELFLAHFDGTVPRVETVGGIVRIRHPRARRNRGRITLNGRIPWAVELRGGASRVRVELGDADLSEIVITGGASHVDLELPRPSRPVPIRFGGGVCAVTLLRPKDVPVRLVVAGGSARLALDHQRFGAVGGPLELRSSDYDDGTAHYDVHVGGGAHALVVASR